MSHIFGAPPEGGAADWTMPQNWQAFTPAQHATWRTLFDQQSGALEGYACTDFLRGLDMLRSVAPGVPDFSALNRRLKPATGWEVVRSEEHTSELQSLMRYSYAVCCLQKKNNL